ncbi:hypothetical protein BKA66DRAFT_416095 [Pyrenochaeta sp. MPI-SDFR-AT-0127]|nr:hypothetical protein BKA66DRAFT_416095 [Pyrenochaeta sp. MPI-SDFR-AT-0127]
MSRSAQLLRTVSIRRSYSTKKRFRKATCLHYDGKSSIESFNPKEPVIFKGSFNGIPAIGKWFIPSTANSGSHELSTLYLEQYGDSIIPLELTRSSINPPHTSTFERFEAPVSLLLAHMTGPDTPGMRLYLAQHSLPDLPEGLQADLPTPTLLSRLGRGDIYASSLWMGRPPTRTPLHRDPNPNLFVQLAGQKIVRLMMPEVGRGVYEKVKLEVGRKDGMANMRGAEMMEGEEMGKLEKAVWGCETGSEEGGGVEAELERGDGLYIPLGWWHAVRGFGTGANASVNWWFR